MRTGVHDLIREAARAHPARPALTFKDVTLTYAELWARTQSVAAGFVSQGVRRNDRIAVFLEKRLEVAIALFAASLAGGVFVPVNPVLKAAQVAYILRDCAVTTLVTSPQRLELLADELPACSALSSVVLVGAGRPKLDCVPVSSWAELDTGDAAPANAGIDMDMAAILYTSGSTGNPKGVVLSHRNLIVGAESVSTYLGNTSDDVILSVLPLSFDAGLSQLTTAFSVGAQVVLHNHLVPVDVVRLCAQHAVTGLTCVPPLWAQIADLDWPDEAIINLRYFANTGGRMPKPTLDQLRETFPYARPFLMYGLTEAFRSTFLDPSEVDRHPDSIGKAIPNAEVFVVRGDGSECDPGEAGELVHRGALVALGYWNDPERTAERFKPVPGSSSSGVTSERAVWSGDAVVRDEEGLLYFVGRNDDMIKTSGYRVSPTEVEEVAYSSGLIRSAVAVGADDEALGQRILLIVAPKDVATFRAEGLLASMRKVLPLFMVPAAVHQVDEIPRSPNGKFDRARLKTEYGA